MRADITPVKAGRVAALKRLPRRVRSRGAKKETTIGAHPVRHGTGRRLEAVIRAKMTPQRTFFSYSEPPITASAAADTLLGPIANSLSVNWKEC